MSKQIYVIIQEKEYSKETKKRKTLNSKCISVKGMTFNQTLKNIRDIFKK